MKHEMNELELSPEQRLHALLCAYVLGELDDAAERAEVEAALAADEALRAERARLEGTIALVGGALAEHAPAQLSQGATARLDAAVVRRAPRPWYNRTWVRAAAAIAILTGGVLLVRRYESEKRFAPAAEHGFAKKAEGEFVASAAGERKSEDKRFEDKLTAGLAPESRPTDSAGFPVEIAAAAQLDASETSAAPPATEAPEPIQVWAENEAPVDTRSLRVLGYGGGVGGGVTGKELEQLDNSRFFGVREQLQGGDARQDGAESSRLVQDWLEQSEEKAKAAEPTVGLVTAQPNPSPAPTGGLVAPPLAHSESKSATRGAASVTPGSPPVGGAGGGGARMPVSGKPAASPEPGASKEGDFKARTENFFDEPVLKDAEVEVLEEEVVGGDFDGKKRSSDDFYLGRGDDERGRIALQRQTELRRLRSLEQSCFPRPNERPRDMFFRFWGDNPFELTALDRLSTFSADVDTASYALARRYLVDGHLPTKEQVRTEEFVNYFKGDVPPPNEGTFRVALELAPSLFGDDSNTWMLRVALRGREVAKTERKPVALTFVIDVSGSMREENRLELVKHALRLLVGQLDARDTISLVKFSNDAALVLPPTSARHRDLIESAIHPLAPEGSTNTEAGLRMGYAQASAALTQGANNRVVLLTDGVANVGITDPNSLVAMVESSRRQGVLLNTVGVGMDNHNDNLLEQLADKGDGLCNYVDDEAEVRRALVDNFTGAFEAIARDVKLQVEFDPAQVERYRLLGYENRVVADADFRNAKVDAAEMGAGHQVVALYEIVRRGPANPDGPLATARVRWKAPYANGVADAESNESESEIEARIGAREAVGAYAQASAGYRRSVLVGQFAEFLRRSVHARHDSLDRLIGESEALANTMRDAEFGEFVSMVKKSRELVLAELRRRDWLDDCSDLIRHNRFLREQVDELRLRLGEVRRSEELELESRRLRERIEELQRRIEDSQSHADRELVERLQAENLELQRRVIELLERLAQLRK